MRAAPRVPHWVRERAAKFWQPLSILNSAHKRLALRTASLNLLGRSGGARSAALTLKQVFSDITLRALPFEPIRPPESKQRSYEALSEVDIPGL